MSKITQSARGEECIRCQDDTGKVRACHYNGPRQHVYGKGRGIKCNDRASADFCDKCDAVFTEGTTDPERWANKWERSEEFHYWIMLTNFRRDKKGVL